MRSVGSRTQLWLVQRLPPARPEDGVVMHERFASVAVLDRVRCSASAVVVWAVTELDHVRELVELGVDGAIIDDLDLIAAAGAIAPPQPGD